MMRAMTRRIGGPAWLVPALLLVLPTLVEAQLFPNQNVKRERQPCASEPPFYATVRQNYFGYYPTCWSRFPEGWACPCPNPELPNAAAEFARQKRDPLPTGPPDEGLDGMPGDDLGPLPNERGADDGQMPPVPNAGRSPFNSDPSASEAPNDRNPRGTNLPPETMRTPSSRTNPKPTTTSVAPPVPSTTPPVPTTGLLEMPRMLPPVAAAASARPELDPGMIALAPDATLTSTGTGRPERPDLGPLPAAPPAGDGSMGIDPTLISPARPIGVAVGTPPAQAPQRRGVLGGLFGGSKRRR